MKLIDIEFIENNEHGSIFDVIVETGFWKWKKRNRIEVYTTFGINWYNLRTGANIMREQGMWFDQQLENMFRAKKVAGTLYGREVLTLYSKEVI